MSPPGSPASIWILSGTNCLTSSCLPNYRRSQKTYLRPFSVKQLEAAGIDAPDGLAYLPSELLNCGVIVHAGNAGMAMAGIAAGIPQVMIRTQLPHALQAVEKARCV